MTVIHLKKKDIVKSKVRGIEMGFDHEKLATITGSGENRRRDDDVNAQEGEAEKEDEGNKDDFDWEAVIDEAAVEGNPDAEKGFMMLEDETRGSPEVREEIPPVAHKARLRQKEQDNCGVDPSGPTSREVEFTKFRASLKGKGQTDFMMIWRRPKQRMPDF
ncbi:hypothetical protein Dimus_000711 [Dionaea muscipula]